VFTTRTTSHVGLENRQRDPQRDPSHLGRPHGLSLALLTYASPAPVVEPQLGSLVAGFLLLVAGLAALTVRRHRHPLPSASGTRRALSYAVVYALCSACFVRVISGALLGQERSPWLLALADVIFVTIGLYVWVMALAEGYPFADYGFRRIPAGRVMLTGLMGLGAVVVYALGPYRALFTHHIVLTADTLVFSVLYAGIGSALPDEMLFRGYLMSSLDGRVSRWARVAIPAIVYTVLQSAQYFTVQGLGSAERMFYIFGVVLPLGLWWGLMRELAGGSLWPCLASHFLLELGTTLAGTPPALP
jgi:membrane protease YdiL (CAAX protease family)